jgi:signal transduction histidine kinase
MKRLALLLYVFCPLVVAAQTNRAIVELPQNSTSVDISQQLYCLADTAKLTIDEAFNAYHSNKFEQTNMPAIAGTDYWVAFNISNPTSAENNDWYLHINRQYHNKIYSATSTTPIAVNGYYTRYNESVLPLSRNHLALSIDTGRTQTFLIHINQFSAEGAISIKMVAANTVKQQLEDKENTELILLGIIIAIAIYNLLLYGFLNDKTYLYYVLYVSGACTFIFLDTIFAGTAFEKYFAGDCIGILAVTLFAFSYLHFSRNFLQTAVHYPAWDRLSRYLQWPILFTPVLVVAEFSKRFYTGVIQQSIIDNTFIAFIAFLVVLYCCILGIYAFVKKHQLAHYFVLANLPLVIVSFMLSANYISRQFNLHFFEFREPYYFFSYAIVSEIILFGILLAYRYKMMRLTLRDKELENIELEKQNIIALNVLAEQKNKELEEKVVDRTASLQTLNEELVNTNQTKDKLLSIISHDLRSPIASLKNVLEMVSIGDMTHEEFKTISVGLSQNVNAVFHTMDNLLQWSQTQLRGIKANPKTVELQLICEEIKELFTAITAAKNVHIINNLTDDMLVYADENHVKVILRNLIANAVKFSHSGSDIVIKGTARRNFIRITVTDSGIGISQTKIEEIMNAALTISSTGTKGEKGTGIGLLLCREFIETNGGKMTIQSELGKGTTVGFTLLDNNLPFSSVLTLLS